MGTACHRRCDRPEETLHTALGDYQNDVVTYAFSYLVSPEEQAGFLWIGAADGIKIWLNGEVVLTNDSSGRHRLAAEKIPIHLQPGENRLLAKVMNLLGEYSFSVAVVDEDGDALLSATSLTRRLMLPNSTVRHRRPSIWSPTTPTPSTAAL